MVDNPGVNPPPTKDNLGPNPPPPTDESLSKEQVQSMVNDALKEAGSTFRDQIGLKEGQRIDHVVHGVTKQVWGIPDGKSATEHLADTIKTALAPPAKDEEGEKTENEVLNQTVLELTKSVKDLKDENATVRVQATESNRKSIIRDLLDKKGVDPNLAGSFNQLVSNGLLGPNLPKPALDGESLVVEVQGDKVPFEGILDKFLEGNQHWVGEHTAPGSGATGNDSLPTDAVVPTGASGDDYNKRAAHWQQNPEATEKAMDKRINDLSKQIPGVAG